MTITWFGLSSFKIIGKEVTIITDPFGKKTGLAAVRGSADIVVSSNKSSNLANNFSSISGNPFIIAGPGEFDLKGAFILGTLAEDQTSMIYTVELEDIRIAFLGLIKQTQLTDQQKETLEGADIVLIPVGDKQVLDFETAAKIATQLEPFIIIPHSYKMAGLTIDLDKPDKFIKEMGGKPLEMDRFVVKKKDLSGEATQVVILTPQR